MNKRIILRLSMFLCALLVFSGVVSNSQAQAGRTFYVALTGNDANPGTEAQPFRTLAKGVSVLQPGDTLLVRKGLYAEELRNTIPSGLSWEKPVTLRAYPGEEVVIKPNQGAERVISLNGDKHHIIIEGFTLDGTNVKYECIKLAGVTDGRPSPSYIRILRNKIQNAGASTLSNGLYQYFGGGILSTGNSNYIEYIGNTIFNNGVTDFDHGIYHTSSYSLIEGNVIYGNMGTGIKIGWGQNAVNNIVRNNVIYDNNVAPGEDGRKKQGRGIGVYAGSGTLVYNNVVWGSHAAGIEVNYNGNDAKVFNNTVMATAGYGIVIAAGANDTDTVKNAVVKNNIVYQGYTYPAILNARGINTVIENNLTYGQNPRVEGDPRGTATIRNNFVNQDPRFVNAGAKNFALQMNSPAIDKGVVVSEVSFDFAKVARPQGSGFDIGAFEFVGVAAPPPVTATPVPPTQAVPPTPTPVVFTNPTLYTKFDTANAAVGSTVSLSVNLTHFQNLYGVELRCVVDPAVLEGVSTTEGTIFTKTNSLFADRGYAAADGSWTVAATRLRPEPPFSGDGVALKLNYRVRTVAPSAVTCTAIAVDGAGSDLSFDLVNTQFAPGAPAAVTPVTTPQVPEPTATPRLEVPLPTEPPLPTEVPLPQPTAMPTSIAGTISGVLSYQGQSGGLGIIVQLLTNDQVVSEQVTSETGSYNFTNVAPGQYVLKASAPQHLPLGRAVMVDGTGTTINLNPMMLLAGDLDSNTAIDLADASLISANFGLEGTLFPPADLNRDSLINIFDLVLVGMNYGLKGVIMVDN
ncbi:MAG: right-handed parallel beta-helix repeat-containing protein [Chloroflexi bacterium]|nr:right-handed parallel beta-helix repeat-containing protein [Chloroflexota bacterium]